jgi:hypothetical protein
MRHAPIGGAVLLMLAMLVTPAAAHPDVAPKQLRPGDASPVVINLTHGCDGEAMDPTDGPIEEAATTQVVLEAPAGVGIEAREIDGWSVTAQTGDQRIVWSSDDPVGVLGSVQLPIVVDVPEFPDGRDIWLPLVQGCANGMAIPWTHPGTTRGGDEMPAMRLVVRGGPGDDPSAGSPSFDLRRHGLPAGVAAAGVALAFASRRSRSRRSHHPIEPQ